MNILSKFRLKIIAISLYSSIHAAVSFTDYNGVSGSMPVAPNSTTSGLAAFSEPTIADGTSASNFTLTTTTGVSVTIREGDYDRIGLGTETTGPIVDDYSDAFTIIANSNNIGFESSVSAGGNGTGQNSGSSDAFGFDTGDGSDGSNSNTLIFDFTDSMQPVRVFDVDILDLEGGNNEWALVGVFDLMGGLLESYAYDWGAEGIAGSGGFGDDSEINFVIEQAEDIGYIAFVVGDDNQTNSGTTEVIAAADFYAAIPEPSTLFLGLFAFFLAFFSRRRITT